MQCTAREARINSLVTFFPLLTPTHGHAGVGQPGRTYISLVQTLDVVWRTCQEQRMIETDGEREKEIERVREMHAVSTT